MKVKQIIKEEGFRPITLTVTIETISELKTLWNRLNASDEKTSDDSKYYGVHKMEPCEIDGDRLFCVIDDILNDLDV